MGRVLDEAEVPVAGATVRLADGTQATTDARGGFTLRGDPSFTMIEVAKAGYATSQVHGLTALPDLHLRSAIGLSQPFVRRTERFTGTIGWPAADLSAGTVYYVDDRRNSSLPGQLAADGSFAVQMKQDSAGAPVAVLFAVAKDLQGRDLVGYSAPFSAFGGTAPTTVAMALADQPIAYQGTATPTGLSEVRASLDVLQAGGSPLTIATRLTASGTFFAPLTGLLPGTMRVTLTARDPAGDHESILAVVPSSGQADGIWLAPPTAQVNAATRTISWVVDPAASGYRLEVRHDDTTGPRWEGFTRGNTLTVPAEAWPASGAGEIHLQAIATSDFSARTIASVPARALRVAPWEQQVSFRMAQHRVRL